MAGFGPAGIVRIGEKRSKKWLKKVQVNRGKRISKGGEERGIARRRTQKKEGQGMKKFVRIIMRQMEEANAENVECKWRPGKAQEEGAMSAGGGRSTGFCPRARGGLASFALLHLFPPIPNLVLFPPQ